MPWQKTVVVGAGPVGALAALYAARRGDQVEVYELRDGRSMPHFSTVLGMMSSTLVLCREENLVSCRKVHLCGRP